MKLSNNTILITGGTSGIGLELATKLLALGNTVVITGRDQARLDSTRKQLPGLHTFRSDVSDPQAIADLYKEVSTQFPALNMLINNAGEMRRLDLLDPSLSPEDVNREIAINLSGPIRMIQQFLPLLRRQASAAIVNVTSGLAFVPFPMSPVYSATKSGLRAYTRTLRVQLKRTGIKVFELAAPAINTPLIAKFGGDMSAGMLMEPAQLVAATLKAIQNDQLEIAPGMSKLLRFMSRFAPGLIFAQLSKAAEKSLAAGAQ